MEKKSNKKIRVYFAHPMNTYNTPLEQLCLSVLQKRQPDWEILNPNTPEFQQECKKEGMPFFKKLVDTCDVLVALPFADGALGAGVIKEAAWMKEKGGRCWVLYGKELLPMEKAHSRLLTVEETRKRLKEEVWHSHPSWKMYQNVFDEQENHLRL
jgi:hypothetical protein